MELLFFLMILGFYALTIYIVNMSTINQAVTAVQACPPHAWKIDGNSLKCASCKFTAGREESGKTLNHEEF